MGQFRDHPAAEAAVMVMMILTMQEGGGDPAAGARQLGTVIRPPLRRRQ